MLGQALGSAGAATVFPERGHVGRRRRRRRPSKFSRIHLPRITGEVRVA